MNFLKRAVFSAFFSMAVCSAGHSELASPVVSPSDEGAVAHETTRLLCDERGGVWIDRKDAAGRRWQTCLRAESERMYESNPTPEL